MSGQQMFQIVSAGKTLRAKPPIQVVQEAVSTFSISSQQAKKLLLKGWVIRDQLSSKQVVEYRTQLQKIGLKVEVHPAGKFDNQELLAKLRFAEQRRARQDGTRPPENELPRAVAPANNNSLRTKPPASGNPAQPGAREQMSRAQEQLEALFSSQLPVVNESAGERAQLLFGAALAALVPGVFALFSLICVYAAVSSLWNIPQAILAGKLSAFTLLGSLLSLGLITFLFLLLPAPFFAARRYVQQMETPALPLRRDQAPGLFLLLKVLAKKTGLPQPQHLSVCAGADVSAETAGLRDAMRQQLQLKVGLGGVSALSGGEWLAMVVRTLALYNGKLTAATAWLVLDSAKNLQLMQWALENERSFLAPNGDASMPVRPLHQLLAICGRALIPLLDKLQNAHRALTGPVARLLERRGDVWMAQMLGSQSFTRFAEKWHQLVHAELVTGEINREASLVGQRLADYPAAVSWQLRNLDKETRSNIELAMSQPSDSWDRSQAADIERIGWAEELELPALLAQTDFSAQKLFVDFAELSAAVSKAAVADDCRAIENLQLLRVSREVEQAQQVLVQYFNRALPRRFLSLQLPQNEDLRAMDLQSSIDWLRGKLVDLSELDQRCDKLMLRGTTMQLGASLIKAQVKIDHRQFFLSGATPAAADESLKDNAVRLDELETQRRQIFSIFYLRITLAIQAMAAGEQRRARAWLEQLAAYDAVAGRLFKLDQYGDLFGLMIDQLTLDNSQRELVQKYLSMAAQELQALGKDIMQSTALSSRGLQEALEARAGKAELPALPRDRQGLVDLLQAMELKCKNASALLCEDYRIQLAQLLQTCIERERALKVKPLRLVKVSGEW